MSTWTLSQLREAVQQRGELENSTDITSAILTSFVNEAITELWDVLREKADELLVTSTTLTTTPSVAAVALPADFYKLRKLEMVADAPSGYRQLKQISLDAQHRYPANGTVRGYRLQGGNIHLIPASNAAESLRLYYVPFAPVLDADGDTFDGLNGYEELVVQLAYKRCLVRQELDTSGVDGEIGRLMARISAAADGRDNEPFYLSPDGYPDEDDWERHC